MLLVDTPAVRVRADRVITVAGSDRLAYLHSLLSQDLASATPGTVADFLYLDAKGNAFTAGRAVVHAERVHLVVPAETAEAVAERLDGFRFLMQVQVALVEDWRLASIRHGTVQVEAPGARPQPMTAVPHGAGLVVRDRSGGVDLLGPEEWVAERLGALGLEHADDAAWHAWRVLAAEPAWGFEITAGRRPQELGLLPTHVHLRKGCYPGQESIAKVYNLGRPRRALALVRGADELTADTTVTSAGRDGVVTTAAGRMGLALLPLTRDGAFEADLRVAGQPLAVLRRVGEGLPQPGAA